MADSEALAERIDQFARTMADPYAALLSADALECMEAVLAMMYASHPGPGALFPVLVSEPRVDRSGETGPELDEDGKVREGGDKR
jgi:hypothetical protein